MLLVILIHSFVRVALGVTELISLLLLPFPVTVFESINKLPSVAAPILPLVLAESLRFAFAILAHVAISICEEV